MWNSSNTLHQAMFRRAQLEEFVDIHGANEGLGGELSETEIGIIKGALKFSEKVSQALPFFCVLDGLLTISCCDDLQLDSRYFLRQVAKEAMTPLSKVFSLSSHTLLSKETFHNILCSGHSRIPIYKLSASVSRCSALRPVEDLW